MQIVNIVLWAVVAIIVVTMIFGLVQCLLGSGTSLIPHFR
jgi:hypothetical protein